ncbi:MAG: hypothetical protein JRN06_04375 [Nitrososphaerota archaeon]|nr:hypothetical protein [Nitrososphaerota archaeon]MDG7023857.1 hypothetical protein [Nitrososphaerota archaeon]
MSSEIAEDLSRQTRDLITRFEGRASSFSRRRDLARLTLPVEPRAAEKAALEFFGAGEHLATGIDGSMDFDERLQMILFYANATAYSSPFSVGDRIRFDLGSAHRDSRLGASAAVPLWAEDLSSVVSSEPEIDIDLEHSMERIPNSFMTLGELYLAYLSCQRSKLVFLDRPMSGTYSTLARDARNMIRRGDNRLGRWSDEHRASMLDFDLALRIGPPTAPVPTRPRHLPFAILRSLIGSPGSLPEIAARLGTSDAETKRGIGRLVKYDKRHDGAVLADASETNIKVRDELLGYWERALDLAIEYSGDVFSRKRHPLALKGDEYLTILDVNALAFVLLEGTVQRARESGTLLVGIAKDTTATDVSRAMLPYAASAGFIKLDSPAPMLKNDRAFLAILSAENPGISTPWRTLGYDSAFSTMVEVNHELRSARKVVSREQLFVRSYFQLRTLRNDPSVRSQVFLFDRTFDPRYDAGSVRRFSVNERSGATRVDCYFEGGDQSPLSNLVLHILSMNDNPEVFEAFGHNQLLYLADKAVKAEVRMMRSSLRGVADLRVGGVTSRRKIFGLATPYRQQRAEAEHARMRQ